MYFKKTLVEYANFQMNFELVSTVSTIHHQFFTNSMVVK